MNRFFHLACLMVALAVAPSATFAAHVTRAVAHSQTRGAQSGTREGGCTFEQGSPTLAFYIPRPLRGPHAQGSPTLAFYIPRPLRGPRV